MNTTFTIFEIAAEHIYIHVCRQPPLNNTMYKMEEEEEVEEEEEEAKKGTTLILLAGLLTFAF